MNELAKKVITERMDILNNELDGLLDNLYMARGEDDNKEHWKISFLFHVTSINVLEVIRDLNCKIDELEHTLNFIN